MDRDIDQDYGNPWVPTLRSCRIEECTGNELEKGWWDDTEENGGACIGTLLTYDNPGCEWIESL